MRIFLTGGTGYIGRHVVAALRTRGDTCIVVSRSDHSPWIDSGVHLVRGNPTLAGTWQAELDGCDAVINLAGAPIVEPPKRWTDARKRVLRDSRVETTRRVVEGMRQASRPPRTLVSASAIGYYGGRGDTRLDESASPGTDFLGKLSVDWEGAAQAAEPPARVAVIRTGMVLGPGAPVLAPMVPLFKLGLGGWWGRGDEWWSWIHIADEVGLILHLLDHDLRGAFNLTAPNPVTVKQFAKTLGRVLRRPVLVGAPGWLVRLGLGEAADALLHLQRVVPHRAVESGYVFRYAELEPALRDALR